MTKDRIIQIRNASFEAMLTAQAMMEGAVNPFQKNVAEAIYEAHNALYQLLCDRRFATAMRGERENAEEEN